jgi:ribosomal-protein-alanine N-acetyltransferase
MKSLPAGPTELRTRRLLLRPPTLDDLDAYVAIATDPEYAYFGARIDAAPESVAAGLARIVAAPWERRAEFAIVIEGLVIGRVRLEFDQANQTAELGYGVARPYWGRGIATEAARATIDYAFSELTVAKIWARVDPRNVGSVRVLEKLGMLPEGLLRSHVIRRGERADRAYYGLLREEWIVQQTAPT